MARLSEHELKQIEEAADYIFRYDNEHKKVVHARWINVDGTFFCSYCGEETWYSDFDQQNGGGESNYCPCCGAKMDLTGSKSTPLRTDGGASDGNT